jgi:hypothetical protein
VEDLPMRNMARYAIALAGSAILLGSCQPSSRREPMNESCASLTWLGYDGVKEADPGKASYVFNGKATGQGRKGFAAVLASVARMSAGSELLIYPDRRVLDSMDAEGCGFGLKSGTDPVPFRQVPEFHEQLRKLAREHSIDIWYLAGPPGEYVLDDGGDLRVKGD